MPRLLFACVVGAQKWQAVGEFPRVIAVVPKQQTHCFNPHRRKAGTELLQECLGRFRRHFVLHDDMRLESLPVLR